MGWPRLHIVALALPFALIGCRESRPGPVVTPAQVDRLQADRPIDPEFVLRGLLTLKPQLGGSPRILEIRADGASVSVQLGQAGHVREFIYRETGDQKHPHQIVGPSESPLVGEGDLDANLFPLADVDIAGIGRQFEMARKAVDPTDGRVTRLIVRRNLPFGDAVRARIYVDSPRLPGSMDTNATGVPLRRAP